MDDQVFHVTLLEHADVILNMMERNVSPAKVVTRKLVIDAKVSKYSS